MYRKITIITLVLAIAIQKIISMQDPEISIWGMSQLGTPLKQSLHVLRNSGILRISRLAEKGAVTPPMQICIYLHDI